MKHGSTPGAGTDDSVKRQRRQLARWLADWNLDAILRSADAAEPRATPQSSAAARQPASPSIVPPGPAANREGPPAPGDIRMLRPRPEAASDLRPVYLAVLEAGAGNKVLVAPFGRFSEPAVPSEWRTGLRAPALRVLCLWGAIGVSVDALRTSRRAGRLSRRFCRRALEVYGHLNGTAPLATVPAHTLGPPLLHPVDPRRIYLAEEAGVLDELRGLPDGSYADTGNGTTLEEWRLAAETPPPYGTDKDPDKG